MSLLLIFFPTLIFAESIPTWFLKPDTEKICGKGSGLSKRIATLQAKSDFIAKIKIYVSTESEMSSSSNGSTKFKSETHLQSHKLVKNLEIVREENIDKTYYIMMCQKNSI